MHDSASQSPTNMSTSHRLVDLVDAVATDAC